MHTDHVHVALTQHEPAHCTALCDLQCKYRFRFVVHQRFRAVDILWFGIVQHPPAERDDIAPQVKDGGHHPLPEQAVDTAGLAALEQAAGIQLLLVVALIPQVQVQGLSVIGCIAQSEPCNGLIVQSAPPPVGPRLPCFLHSGVQTGMEKARSLLVHGKDAAAHPARLVVLLRFGHSGPRRQQLDGLRVIDAVDLSDKADGIACRLTAKAVEALGVRVDIERGRFLAVEGTQTAVQPPFALELHIAAHQLYNVGAAGQFLNVFVWDHGSFKQPFKVYNTCHFCGTKISSKVRMANSSLMPLM